MKLNKRALEIWLRHLKEDIEYFQKQLESEKQEAKKQ